MEIVKRIEDMGEAKRNALKDAIANGKSTVQKLYDDAVVFVTGASGFLGKQLVEKLLSSTNVKKIYILLRMKRGKNVEQRFKKILDDPVYEFVRKDNPNFMDKIIPIEGDVSNLNLGIGDEDWLCLTNEVNIIFHSAATINFVDPVKKATLTNIRGTREVLKLAKSCKFLKSIVHISTAFSNATKSRINREVKEDFYTSPIEPDVLINLAEYLDEDKLDTMIKPLMLDWPNSYTFTKAVTEDLVRSMSEDLPLCIVRPAIVIAAHNEPTPGWVDVKNAFGPSGILIGLGLGVIHTLLIKKELPIEFVPVDIVNNATIVAAWETYARYKEADKQTTVYTITNARNPLYGHDLKNVLITSARHISLQRSIWYCFGYDTSYKFIHYLLSCILHYIPAAIIDGSCVLIGIKPRLLKVYKLIGTLTNVFAYFLNNKWLFQDDNTQQLYNKLSDIDKEIYNFDIRSINVNEMILIWALGIKKYIVKEDLQQIDYANKRQFWLKIVHYAVFPIYLLLLFSAVYFFFMLVINIFK